MERKRKEKSGASAKRRARDKMLNVFSGPEAVKDFMDPENYITPLIELPAALNPFADQGVHIFAKALYLLPLLNVKSLPAFHMLRQASQAGQLSGVHTVVENSSGSFAFSLAILSKIFDIPNVTAFVPWDIAPGKLDLLRLAGVGFILNKDPENPDETSGIAKAKRMGKQEGFFNPSQYDNEANPEVYQKILGPQLWQQTDGGLTVFCTGVGTSGTVLGTSRYLKKKFPHTTVVGVIASPENQVPGVRSYKKLREVSLRWKPAVDFEVEVNAKESFKKSLELCRAGIMGGPSSGFALAGLLKFLHNAAASGFQKFRNKDGEVVAVFTCPDTPLPYLEKYSTHLDPSDF